LILLLFLDSLRHCALEIYIMACISGMSEPCPMSGTKILWSVGAT
jgi:hypothetical protein